MSLLEIDKQSQWIPQENVVSGMDGISGEYTQYGRQ